MTTQADQREPITHDEAAKLALTFINHFFNNPGRDKPQASIPADPSRDTDIRLMAYIRQQKAKDQPPPTSTVEPKGEKWLPEGMMKPSEYEDPRRGDIAARDDQWRSHCNSLLAQIKASKEPAQQKPETGQGICNKCRWSGVGEVAYGGVLHVGCGYVAVRTDQASPPTPEKERGLKWGCRVYDDCGSWRVTSKSGLSMLHFGRWCSYSYEVWPSELAAISALNACTSAPPDFVEGGA